MQRVVKRALFLAIIFSPLLAIAAIGVSHYHVGVSSLYLATATLVLAETVAGLLVVKPPAKSAEAIDCTAVVVAYLPNESGLIEDTLGHCLSGDFARVLLAYNTPKPMPDIESRLAEWAAQEERLLIVKVEGSSSKAENLNFVLSTDLIRTPAVGIFDSDHRPVRNASKLAAQWLSNGYDAVQGRCVIRNVDSLKGKLVAAEFDAIYRLLHTSRFRVSGTAIFGGSNGYWNTEVIRALSFRKVLTEDIDLSLRAIARGIKIAHDPRIISTEEAPPTWDALWKQRVRWAQGWLQVTAWHSLKLAASKHLSMTAKVYWIYNLIYRELFSLFNFSAFFVIGLYALTGTAKAEGAFFNISSAATIGSLLLCILLTAKVAPLPGHRYHVVSSFFGTIPFSNFKGLVTAMAWAREFTRDMSWERTVRCKHEI